MLQYFCTETEKNSHQIHCNQNETHLNSDIIRDKQGRNKYSYSRLLIWCPNSLPWSHGQDPTVPWSPPQQDTQAWLSSIPPRPPLKKEWQVHSLGGLPVKPRLDVVSGIHSMPGAQQMSLNQIVSKGWSALLQGTLRKPKVS